MPVSNSFLMVINTINFMCLSELSILFHETTTTTSFYFPHLFTLHTQWILIIININRDQGLATRNNYKVKGGRQPVYKSSNTSLGRHIHK